MRIEHHAPGYVKCISPYVPGKPVAELAREMGLDEARIIKLASNENPLGPSPLARQAVTASLRELARYPDGNGFALKQALVRKFGLSADQLVLGNGSNELLDIFTRAFVPAGSSGVYSQHAFAVYPLALQAVGARGIEVPARFFSHDLAATGDALAADTRIIYIANPNNPTGTFLPGALIEAFLRLVPEHVLVVLDEAYSEYLQPELRYDSFAWVRRFPNLVVTRTFSKIYGLGGLRVGYAVADPAVAGLANRMREPFNVNSLALAAAEAALDDVAFVERSYATNRAGMAQLVAGFNALNLEYIPSAGNFITVRVGDAVAVNQALLRQGVIVRPVANYGLPDWLRVTVGLETENKRFLAALAAALKG